jgi:hypothetical protein
VSDAFMVVATRMLKGALEGEMESLKAFCEGRVKVRG